MRPHVILSPSLGVMLSAVKHLPSLRLNSAKNLRVARPFTSFRVTMGAQGDRTAGLAAGPREGIGCRSL